jgi:hypothetical protein
MGIVEQIPRGTLFLLWFAARDVLEDMAKPSSDASFTHLQQRVVTSLPVDITFLCKCSSMDS